MQPKPLAEEIPRLRSSAQRAPPERRDGGGKGRGVIPVSLLRDLLISFCF